MQIGNSQLTNYFFPQPFNPDTDTDTLNQILQGLYAAESSGSGGTSVPRTVSTVSANTTVSATGADQLIKVNGASGALTITLPTAVGTTNYYTVIKTDSSVNFVTVAANGTQTIDGAASYQLPSQWTAATFYSDGSNWVTASNGALVPGGGGGGSGGGVLIGSFVTASTTAAGANIGTITIPTNTYSYMDLFIENATNTSGFAKYISLRCNGDTGTNYSYATARQFGGGIGDNATALNVNMANLQPFSLTAYPGSLRMTIFAPNFAGKVAMRHDGVEADAGGISSFFGTAMYNVGPLTSITLINSSTTVAGAGFIARLYGYA